MNIQDKIWITFRQLKRSLVGTILIIIAIATGVSLAAATAAFIGKYNKQTRDMLNHPVYREILVQALGNPDLDAELPLPVVELEGKGLKASQFAIDDLPLVLKSVPNLTYAYLADGDVFQSTTYIIEEYTRGLDEKAKEAAKGKEAKEDRDDKEDEKEELDDEELKKVLIEDWYKEVMKEVTELPMKRFMGVYTSPDFFKAYGVTTTSGSLFTKEDLDSGNMVMVLGSELAAAMFSTHQAIGARISVNRQTYTILGILESTNLVVPETSVAINDLAFVPHYIYAGMAYGKGKGKITTIRFAVSDSDKIQQAVKQVREYIDTEYPGTNVRVSAAVDKLKEDREKSVRILIVLMFLAGAGLFIAAINMFNLLLIRVMKHSKSIGISRVLGYTRNNILQQFLFESTAMVFTGTIMGLAASPFLFSFLQNALLSGLDTGQGSIFWELITGAGIAFLLSIAFGLYPAMVARQTDAATAIRAE